MTEVAKNPDNLPLANGQKTETNQLVDELEQLVTDNHYEFKGTPTRGT